jgi:hypothetical protein
MATPVLVVIVVSRLTRTFASLHHYAPTSLSMWIKRSIYAFHDNDLFSRSLRELCVLRGKLLISCLAHLWVVILVGLRLPLDQRLRHCDSKGLRDNAYSYAAYPIAKMPYGRQDAFCLAAPLVVSLVERLRYCDSRGFRGRWLIYATHPIAEMPHRDGDGFCLAVLLAVSQITAC